jgi:hypothetical protein
MLALCPAKGEKMAISAIGTGGNCPAKRNLLLIANNPAKSPPSQRILLPLSSVAANVQFDG